VGNMSCSPLQGSPSHSRSPPGADHVLTPEISEFRQGSIISHCAENLAVESEYGSSFGVAKPRRVLNQGIEDWLQIKGGATDDLEHFTCHRLLLQCFSQVTIALLQFLEQPHILDGDDRLVGEGFEELDLLIRERPDRLSPDNDHSNGDTFPEHRNSEYGPETADFLSLRPLIIGVRQNIVNMNRPSF